MQARPEFAQSATEKVSHSEQAFLTFMALKSFFIFSGIPVMKESSGSSRISPFSSFKEKNQVVREDPVPVTCTGHAVPRAGPAGLPLTH